MKSNLNAQGGVKDDVRIEETVNEDDKEEKLIKKEETSSFQTPIILEI